MLTRHNTSTELPSINIGWGLIIIHSNNNYDWLINNLHIYPGGIGQYIHLIRANPIEYNQANSLPMSTALWESIPINCETLLYIQPDGFMIKSPIIIESATNTKLIDPEWNRLLQYPYLGAPWESIYNNPCTDYEWCRYGGNGGISIRKRSVMLDLIRELVCDKLQCHYIDYFNSDNNEYKIEDVFLAYRFYQYRSKYQSLIAPVIDLAKFSIESYDLDSNINPYFIHAIWRWNIPKSRWIKLLANVKKYYLLVN